MQRPGLKALFDIDLENLRLLAEQLDRGEEGRDFVGIYRECAAVSQEPPPGGGGRPLACPPPCSARPLPCPRDAPRNPRSMQSINPPQKC